MPPNLVNAPSAKSAFLPNGAFLFAEVRSAKPDADKKPITGSDGFFVADQLLFYTAMARDAGWGKVIPAVFLPNELIVHELKSKWSRSL